MSLDRLPFTPIDEAVYGLDTDTEPWTIQLELRVAGHLDEERLGKALRMALDHHPMARGRMAPAAKGDRRHFWRIRPEPDLDPLRVVRPVEPVRLAAQRADLYSLRIGLSESPPLRVRLVHHPDGDLLMASVHHAAFDGFGALRVLHSVARAYTGRPDPAPPVELPRARELESLLGAGGGARGARIRRLADKLRDLASPPARLAADGGKNEPGFGFHHVSLSPEQTQALTVRDGPGTVNDVLMAALNLAVDAWNDGHGEARRRVSVLLPVNLRPVGWREDMVTNLVLDARVAIPPGQRTGRGAVLDAVIAETRRIKEGGAAALWEALRVLPSVPRPLKDRLAGLLAVTGDRLVDTAILSNLGEVDHPPDFGSEAGEITEMWFSAPTRMPCALSLGTVAAAGRLHLSFRYRHPLWDADAASRFARIYVGELGRLAGQDWEEKGMPMSDDDRALDRLITQRVEERVGRALAEQAAADDPLTRQLVHGDESRLHVDPSAVVNNALFNLSSGDITVGPHAIFGHGVSVLTGTHDVNKFGPERKQAIPREGRDIVIGEGAWVASNATVLGPSTIGEHAVVAAGALVQGDVEPYTVVAGVPAKEVKRIDKPASTDTDE